MPVAMFSKFKSGNQLPQNPIEANPITQYFEISKSVACAGPELVWKIYDAYRKSDGKVSAYTSLNTVISLQCRLDLDRNNPAALRCLIQSSRIAIIIKDG